MANVKYITAWTLGRGTNEQMREKQKGPEGLQKQPEVLKATNFYDGNINPPSSVQVAARR